jgi:nucleotide-binding universal stress UspA family protein
MTTNIKRILVPTDFSKTASLALDQAVFLAQLCKAELYILHSIEVPSTVYTINEPIIYFRDLSDIESDSKKHLNELASSIKKENNIEVKAICVMGKAAEEIKRAVKKYKIDITIMGTHGAHGFNEYFVGSNAHKTVTISQCPVITVQSKARKPGFTNILLPIDDSLHSRQKVNETIALAKNYSSKIHVLGLIDKDTDPKKLNIKLDSVEKAIRKANLTLTRSTVKEKNLALSALKYSRKVKADLISVLSNHESHLNGIFLDAFAKQIVNHSPIPVLSIRPKEGIFDSVSLAGSNAS